MFLRLALCASVFRPRLCRCMHGDCQGLEWLIIKFTMQLRPVVTQGTMCAVGFDNRPPHPNDGVVRPPDATSAGFVHLDSWH